MSRSASIRVHDERYPTDEEGRGALGPPPNTFTCFIRSSPADVKPNKRSIVRHGKIQNFSNCLPFKNDANFGNYPQTLYNRSRKITSSKCNTFENSPLSRSASIRVRVEVTTDKEGQGALEPPSKTFTCFIRSSSADVKQNKRSRVCHREIQIITIATNYRLEMVPTLWLIQTLQTLRYNENLRSTSSACDTFATSRLSRSTSVRFHVEVRNGHGRARGVGVAPRSRRSNEAIWPRIPVPRIAYWGRDEIKNKKRMIVHIYTVFARGVAAPYPWWVHKTRTTRDRSITHTACIDEFRQNLRSHRLECILFW